MRELHRWQYQYLGMTVLPRQLTPIELDTFFAFSDAELTAINSRYKSNLRIAAAIQLGFLKMAGRPLDALKVIPRELLKRVGEQLNLPAPTIASLRSIYRRRPTLFDHQQWALEALQMSRSTDEQLAELESYLREEARFGAAIDALVEIGKVWLYKHGIVIPADRPIRDCARRAMATSEAGLVALIQSTISDMIRGGWERDVLGFRGDSRQTYLEWLAEPPRKGSRAALQERIERVEFLKSMKVDRYPLPEVPLATLRRHSEDMRRMRPAKFRQLLEPLRTLRLVCFLQWSLMEITDTAVLMAGRHITGLWRKAYQKAELLEAKSEMSSRDLVNSIFAMANDSGLSDAQFRDAVRTLAEQQLPAAFPTRAAAARWLLSEPGTQIRPLLSGLQKLDVRFDEDSSERHALTLVQQLRDRQQSILPDNADVHVSKGWRSLIEGDDRSRALRALEASLLMDLKKGFRSGKNWINHSAAFRHRDEILISPTRWNRERDWHYAQMNMPTSAEAFLQQIHVTLEHKLQQLSDVVLAGDISIGDGVIHLPRLKAEMTLADAKPLRERLFATIGAVQLPELILDIDSRTGFSQALLGRAARSEQELLRTYAGMLAHATAFDATQIAHQIPPLTPEQIRLGMNPFEDSQRIRDANAAVASYQRQLPITRLWGDDKLASSDSTSLDVSQRLWAARLDPRRNTASVGTYTHLVNTGSLIYDQPLVLGTRQAGAAIEGVIRQEEISIDRLAVDTHGYTAFAMAIAKMLGFDLCPRLKRLSERKLYLSRGIAVPAALSSIVDFDVSERLIKTHWDDLVRIAASVKSGQTNAMIALARYGAASVGDPVCRAGMALGRLLRSTYLCDYFISEPYRRLINRILVHGESVHQLQRAIYRGTFSKPRGQREPELIALSGSLTLVTNLCLAWTTTRIQTVLDSKPDWLRQSGTEWLKGVSPGHFHHINFNGTFSFPFESYRERLLPVTVHATGTE
jgi:TnpA family transposase